MRELLILLVHLAATVIKLMKPGGTRAVVAESLILKQQLVVLNRSRKRAPHLKAWDRILLGMTMLIVNPRRIRKLAAVIKPATLFKFHVALKKRKYRLLFSSHTQRHPGPKGPSEELIAVIVEMKRRNPRFGCPRIAREITHAFGIEIDKDVVRRVLAKHYHPAPGNDGPSWLTVIGHARDSLWIVDLFRCESIALKSYWVMVVMDLFTRRIIGFGVEPANIDGIAVCRMFNRAIAHQQLPKYLSSDNDPLFRFYRWLANLRVLDVEEVKSISCVPLSHPFIERIIGTIRREYLDHVFFWTQRDLERKLDAFKVYYNERRVHASLAGQTPSEKSGNASTQRANLRRFTWTSDCNGLFQIPIAA
jgi:putative transposase